MKSQSFFKYFVCLFVCLPLSFIAFGRSVTDAEAALIKRSDSQLSARYEMVLSSKPISTTAEYSQPDVNIISLEDCTTNILLQCCPADDVTIVELTADCGSIDELAGWIIDGFYGDCTEECDAG